MLALDQFEKQQFKLNAQELRLLKDCVAGKLCVISESRPNKAIQVGKQDNVVRVEFIRWLALGGDSQYPLHAHGVQLKGAWIEGVLDLYGAKVHSDLMFLSCHIAKAPNFRNMLLHGSLTLSGSILLEGIDANRAEIAGDVFLSRQGQNRFESQGQIRLLGITIGGDLSFNGARLNAIKGQFALSADRAKIAGGIFFRTEGQNRFESQGQIRLLGATIGGSLSCNGAQLKALEGKAALSADGAEIAGGVFFRTEGQHCFESQGEIRLLGATIGGSLSCNGAQLKALEGQAALSADRAKIGGSVFLSGQGQHRFESQGQIRFLGTSIGGNLGCTGAQLKAFEGQAALSADGAEIAGHVFLREGFNAEGGLTFVSAHVAGIFQLQTNQPVNTIDLSHANISFLQSVPNAWGVGVVLDGLVYDNLRAASWQSKDYIAWLNKQTATDLGGCDIHSFKPQPWHQLIGVLRKIGHQDIATELAITYEQHRYAIGKVGAYQESSALSGSNSLKLRVNNFFKHTNQYIVMFLHATFGLFAGYGYKPLRLLWWMLGVWLFSATMYFCAAYHGIFTPSDPLVFQNESYESDCRSFDIDGTARTINNQDEKGVTHNWYTCAKLMGEYTTFSPVAYSLDVIFPLVDLGQEKTWGVYIATPRSNDELLKHWSWNHAVRLLVWFEVLFGWMASLMLVAVLTGLTERDKS
jgi:hypothetical protein